MRRVYSIERPKADDGLWYWGRQQAGTITVIEQESATPQWTGLYDSAGRKLMVSWQRDPAGFVHFS